MTTKFLALLTVDEATAQQALMAPAVHGPAAEKQVNCRRLVPSTERLRSETREYVLPPQLVPGLLSIWLR